MNNLLMANFVTVLLISLRMMAVLSTTPLYENKAIPFQARIFFAVFIGYIVFLTSGDKLRVEVFEFVPLALLGLKEILCGMVIGFSINMIFYGISFAGFMIGTDMQLTMATIFNPIEESNTGIISDVLYYFALLVFFLINGHHYVIQAAAYSFNVIPIGNVKINKPVFDWFVQNSASVFIIGVKIAAPIMVSFFLINIAEAVIARLVPQMQVFFVTQPLKIGVGFALIGVFIPFFVYFVKNMMQGFQSTLGNLILNMSR